MNTILAMHGDDKGLNALKHYAVLKDVESVTDGQLTDEQQLSSRRAMDVMS